MKMTPTQMTGYITSQQKRFDEAKKNNNQDLVKRLLADSNKYGYKFNNSNPVNPVNQFNKFSSPSFRTGNTTTNKPNNSTYPGMLSNNSNTGSTAAHLKQETNTATTATNMNQNTTMTNQGGTNSNNKFEYNPFTDERYAAYLNNPQPFSYDPKSDPLYKTMLANALSDAKLNSKSAQQNALESLNDRGISNSSIAASQLAQIEQNALTGAQSQLESTLLPQLMNQAYQRYSDDLANKRYQADLARNLTSDAYQKYIDTITNQRADKQVAMQEGQLTGTYNGDKTLEAKNSDRSFGLQQAGLTGMYNGKPTLEATIADRNYNLDQKKLNQAQQQLDYEKERNAKQDTEESKRWWANYTRQGEQWAKQNNLDWARLDQQKKEYVSDQAYKEKNYNLNVRSQDWAESQNNPLNQQREALAESKKQNKADFIAEKKSEFIKLLSAPDQTYESVMKLINDDELAGIYDPADPKENKRIADEIRSKIDQAKNTGSTTSGDWTNFVKYPLSILPASTAYLMQQFK